MFHHPEQEEGEWYLGNFSAHGWDHVRWRTKRAGMRPYAHTHKGEILGDRYWSEGIFPGFVQYEELCEAIRKNNQGSIDEILQFLLQEIPHGSTLT